MNKSPCVLFLTTIIALNTPVLAATDTKTISVQAVQGTYAELTGSAIDGNVNVVSMNNIESNAAVSLGTLGVKSNGDNCALKFTTLNDFSLLHGSSGSLLKRYKLGYLGFDIASNAEASLSLDSCFIKSKALTFEAQGNMPISIEEGWYQDKVTITLTAE